MKFRNEINNILKNSGVQLNEEQSDEFLLVQKIIRKITELKKCFDELSEDEDILYIASDIYDLIDELPAFDEVQRKMHDINDWFYNAIKPLVERDYPDDNYAIYNEPFNEFFQYYPKPAKMYAKMLVNYLPRLEQLFKQDYLEDDGYDGGEEELDESYLVENEVELDDIERQIINAINEYESCNEKSKKINILSQLYFICGESSNYDEPAIDFEQYLLDRALEDQDNMVYSTPSADEVDIDKVMDEFYDELSDNTCEIIEKYSNYSVKGLMEKIEEYCKNYLNDINDEESTIDDEDNIDTLDENYNQNDTDDNIREIYEKLSEYSQHHMSDWETHEIIRMCEDSGYDELDNFINDEIDNMRFSYINDSDNWGKKYDGDATYEKCVNIPLVDKINSYANSYEIERFIDSVKAEIENQTGYSFDNPKQTNIQDYDGSEEELDESVNPENTSEDIEQLKFFFNKLKEDLESLSDYQKQIEDLPRKIKFDCEALCFYIENLPEYGEYIKLKSIKDDFRREVFDTIDLENCEYTQYYDEDEELFDGDSTEAMISNLSDKAFIDEFATYYCVEKFCNNVEKELHLLNNIESYEGDDTELDESVQPKWDYKVGDEVLEVKTGKIWVISEIGTKWVWVNREEGVSRKIHANLIKVEDFPNEYEPVNKDDFKKYVYDGNEEELDESVNKESTPFDKMMKLHKENSDIDIRIIAKKIANDNIEEYISLMKQFYEKFEN